MLRPRRSSWRRQGISRRPPLSTTRTQVALVPVRRTAKSPAPRCVRKFHAPLSPRLRVGLTHERGDGDYPTSQLACPTAPAPRCSCALRSPMQLCPASFTPSSTPTDASCASVICVSVIWQLLSLK